MVELEFKPTSHLGARGPKAGRESLTLRPYPSRRQHRTGQAIRHEGREAGSEE